MAEVLRIDPEELTIGDLEDFEEIAGVSFDEAMRPSSDGTVKMTTKALKAIVFLTMRRDNPGFTLEDARAVKVSALQLATEPDPTAAAG